MHDGHHDHEPASKRDHDGPLTDYQRMEIAVRELLIEKGVLTAEEIRRAIEAMDARNPALGADAYEKLSYYERWIASITKALLARGVITTDELGRRMAAAEGKR